MTRTVKTLLIPSIISGIALCGGCSNWSNSGHATTANNIKSSAGTNKSPAAPATTAANPPLQGEAGSSLARPRITASQAINPFWMDTAAANSTDWTHANPGWMPEPITTTSGADFTTSAMRTAAAAGTMDDGMEGLTHVTYAAEGADFDPCISRDGSFMVYASTQHRATADIYLKSITGRTVTQLTADPAQDLMPAVSPDGRRIAFASNRSGNWDIFVMSTTGGQAVQLTADAAHDLHPTWSSDGSRLAFCRLGQISNRWEIWVSEISGSGSAEFLTYGLFPRWCPKAATADGGRDKILYQRSRERGDRAFSIWTIDYKPGDASSPTEIASSRNSALINAAWSPDGTRVVYSTIENPNSTHRNSAVRGSDLWITSLDGTGRVNLTSGRFTNLMPCWGADNRIYFVSDRSGSNNIWSVGTDKAITAVTGRTPTTTPTQPETDVANAPEGDAGEH